MSPFRSHGACANHCYRHAAFSSGAAAAAGYLVVSGSVGVAPDDVAGGLPQVVALQRIGEVGLEEASLAAAVEPPAFEAQAVEGLPADGARHRVGKLNLAAGAPVLAFQLVDDLPLQAVPSES